MWKEVYADRNLFFGGLFFNLLTGEAVAIEELALWSYGEALILEHGYLHVTENTIASGAFACGFDRPEDEARIDQRTRAFKLWRHHLYSNPNEILRLINTYPNVFLNALLEAVMWVESYRGIEVHEGLRGGRAIFVKNDMDQEERYDISKLAEQWNTEVHEISDFSNKSILEAVRTHVTVDLSRIREEIE